MDIKLISIIKCPNCGCEKEEIMPFNSCVYFYECEKCHSIIKPKQGDCCVFCSYGTKSCPSVQEYKDCCR